MNQYKQDRRLSKQIATEFEDKHSLFDSIQNDVNEVEIILDNYLKIVTQLRDVSSKKISEERAIKVIMEIVDWER